MAGLVRYLLLYPFFILTLTAMLGQTGFWAGLALCALHSTTTKRSSGGKNQRIVVRIQQNVHTRPHDVKRRVLQNNGG